MLSWVPWTYLCAPRFELPWGNLCCGPKAIWTAVERVLCILCLALSSAYRVGRADNPSDGEKSGRAWQGEGQNRTWLPHLSGDPPSSLYSGSPVCSYSHTLELPFGIQKPCQRIREWDLLVPAWPRWLCCCSREKPDWNVAGPRLWMAVALLNSWRDLPLPAGVRGSCRMSSK